MYGAAIVRKPFKRSQVLPHRSHNEQSGNAPENQACGGSKSDNERGRGTGAGVDLTRGTAGRARFGRDLARASGGSLSRHLGRRGGRSRIRTRQDARRGPRGGGSNLGSRQGERRKGRRGRLDGV